MNEHDIHQRYQELQQYVGWRATDADRLRIAGALVAPNVGPLIDDFYAEIERHAETIN